MSETPIVDLYRTILNREPDAEGLARLAVMVNTAALIKAGMLALVKKAQRARYGKDFMK